MTVPRVELVRQLRTHRWRIVVRSEAPFAGLPGGWRFARDRIEVWTRMAAVGSINVTFGQQ